MPTNLYGPNDFFHPTKGHVIPSLMTRMLQAKIKKDDEFLIWGTGTPKREFLYVDDLAECIEFLLEKDTEDDILNVGSNEEITINKLAEKIKYTIGCATPESERTEMSITGRNLAEGIPETFSINSEQIFEAMKDPLYGIVRAIRNALELSPPELAADIAERGIVLTGGGALLRDLDKLISGSTGIPVIVAEDPLTCVARGGGQALEIMDKYNIDLLSSE